MEYKITLTVKEDKDKQLQSTSKITDLKGKSLKLTPRIVGNISVTLLQGFCNFVKFEGFGFNLKEIEDDAIKIIKKELKIQ